MKLKFILLFYCCISQLIDIQAIHIISEDIDVEEYDPEYFQDIDIHVIDDDTVFVNFTIVKMCPRNTYIRWYLLAASMGEYTVETGFDTALHVCDLMNEPIVFKPVLTKLGFRDECPPKPGVYGREYFHVDTSTFPDTFPAGYYVSIVEFTIGNDDDKKMLMKLLVYQHLV